MKVCRLSEVLNRGALRVFLVAVLLCAGLGPQIATACSCASPTLENRYEGSENVFTALIIGGEVTNDRVLSSPGIRAHFEVTETFKGSVPFEYLSSHVGGASCGISLRVGVEYLVFAPNTGKIGLCSGIVAVSGESEQAVAAGSRYVDALRAFTSGDHDTLAEPWQFVEHEGICYLSSSFPYGETGFPAGINVTYWTRMPDNVAPSPDKPHLKAGFTEMTIWVPERNDLTDYPMSLRVGDQEYIAEWQEVEYSAARYFIDSDDVPGLIAGLVDATELRMKSAHPKYGDVDAVASMINAGDSAAKMHQCMSDQLGGTIY